MSDKYYELKYRFSSQLDEMDGERYVTTYKVKIYEGEFKEYSNKKLLIGKLTVKLIHVTLALDNDYPLHYILDTDQYTLEIGQQIFDIEREEIREDIQGFYKGDILNSDICLLTRIEICESHRRQGIGKKVVKDVYNRFRGSCGLFVVQAFPLQFESGVKKGNLGPLPKWSKKMNFSSLENDFEKAFYQLKAFYQKIGFDHIDGYNELMFLNTSFINEKMDKILLE